MALQNRVTPFGDIVVADWRGLVLGNRGVLHDAERRIVRSSQLRRWIACRLTFRGRHRAIMRPRSWTELFFLDESAAFAAGHRPCGECRNADYRRFRALWESIHGAPARAEHMDIVLHADRLDGGFKRTYRADIASLPDGTYVSTAGAAWLVWDRELFAWSGEGYRARQPRPTSRLVDVVTPRAIVAIFTAGYRPLVYPAAFVLDARDQY